MNFCEAYQDSCSQVGLAARLGNADVLQRLLEQGKDYCVHDNRGLYPIHEAACGGHANCVKLLLNAASVNEDNPVEIWPPPYDPYLGSPLSLAVCGNHEDVVKILLPVYGKTEPENVLHKAVVFPRILSLLIDSFLHAVDHQHEMPDSDCEETALHRAVHRGIVTSVRILLSNGADKDAEDEYNRKPLHVASFIEDQQVGEEIVLELVRAGCKVNARDENGCTPLYLATQSGHDDLAKLLLEHGADPHIPMLTLIANCSVNVCPISVAAERGYLSLLELLMQHTDKTKLSHVGASSPILSAVVMSQPKALKLLLDGGYAVDGLLPHCNQNTLPNCFKYGHDMLDNLLPWNFSELTLNTVKIVNILFENHVCISQAMMRTQSLSTLISSTRAISTRMLETLLVNGLIERKFPQMPDIGSLSSLLGYVMADIVDSPHSTVTANLMMFVDFIPNFCLCYVDLLPVLTPQISLKRLCRWKIREMFVKSNTPLMRVHQLNLPKVIEHFILYSTQPGIIARLNHTC